MADDNKIVPFPMDKVKKTKGSLPVGRSAGLAVNNRSALMFSLIFTLLVATLITNQLNDRRQSTLYSSYEGAASGDGRWVANDGSQNVRDLDEDIALAKKIARESLREPASAGREPTAEDTLRHGELAGLYTMGFSEGALTSIVFSETPGTEPRYLSHRDEFLLKHKDLLRLNYSEARRIGSFQDRGYQYEIYALLQDAREAAKVHFKLSPTEQLYSMKVELEKSSSQR